MSIVARSVFSDALVRRFGGGCCKPVVMRILLQFETPFQCGTLILKIYRIYVRLLYINIVHTYVSRWYGARYVE